MSIGVRCLTVLGEFKPFGLIAEALDGKTLHTVTDKYDYFLFDPGIARDRAAEDSCDEVGSALSNRGDHHSREPVYLSLYTTVESMVNQVAIGSIVFGDSLSVSGFKLALIYIEALMAGKLSASKGGIVQSAFVGSLKKQVEEILNCSQELKDDFHQYLKLGKWPSGESQDKRSILLSWFLQWFDVPASSVIKATIDRVYPKLISSSSIPLLCLSFPRTHIHAITEIDRCFS